MTDRQAETDRQTGIRISTETGSETDGGVQTCKQTHLQTAV